MKDYSRIIDVINKNVSSTCKGLTSFIGINNIIQFFKNTYLKNISSLKKALVLVFKFIYIYIPNPSTTGRCDKRSIFSRVKLV